MNEALRRQSVKLLAVAIVIAQDGISERRAWVEIPPFPFFHVFHSLSSQASRRQDLRESLTCWWMAWCSACTEVGDQEGRDTLWECWSWLAAAGTNRRKSAREYGRESIAVYRCLWQSLELPMCVDCRSGQQIAIEQCHVPTWRLSVSKSV